MKVITLEPAPRSLKPIPPRWWYRFCGCIVCLGFRLFFRLKITGAEHLPPRGGCLVASNHVSFFDPPIVGASNPKRELHYFARKDLFDVPGLAWLMRSLNAMAIDRNQADIGGIREALRILQNDGALLVFPEGTRSHDGNLAKPLAGVGMIVARTGVPVVPARIFGAEQAWPRHKKLPRLARISVVLGKAFRFELTPEESRSRETYQAISEEIMRRIAELQPTQ